MQFRIPTLMASIALGVIGCSEDQIKEGIYNAGNQIGCQQSQQNLPQEGLGQLECADPNASDQIDYRTYQELREEGTE